VWSYRRVIQRIGIHFPITAYSQQRHRLSEDS
jgi:hypothetical protein